MTRESWAYRYLFAATATFLLLVAYHARGDESLRSRVAAVAATLPSPDRVDADELAAAVDSATKGNADWAALVLTVATHETHLSARIAAGGCKPWECDSTVVGGVRVFKAWGLLQEHKNLNNLDVWGSPDIGVQVLSGYKLLRRSYWSCKRVSSGNWVAFTINAYAGKRCDAQWPGLDARLATFSRIRGRL